MDSTDIRIATADDIGKLIPVFKELRPHRTEDDLRQLFLIAFQEGYKVAYIGTGTLAYSVLGFRIQTCIFSGRTLTVDDLATLSSEKNKGHAGRLFQWVKEYAKMEKCDHLNLDSGFQRHDAYRFYLNQGLHVESLHFGRKVAEL